MLTFLYLSGNQLSGSIPTQLEGLTNISALDLRSNRLSGEIPTIITSLTNLGYFGFDHCAGLTTSDLAVIEVLDLTAPGWDTCDQEISVHRMGSTVDIPNGDTSPTFNEGTDLGGVGMDKAGFANFTIWNTGSSTALQLMGDPYVTISGDPSFTVRTQPYSQTVNSGSSIGFRIRFAPVSLGLHTATVSVASNDADEDPYTFTIQGVGARSDNFEDDDDFTTASSLIPGVTQHHSIFPMGDSDYTKFTLTGYSTVVLETSGEDGYDTEIALYDASHTLVGYDNDGGDLLYSRLEKACLPPGEYTLRTYVYEGVIMGYDLDLSANPCATISGNTGVSGATLSYTDGTAKTVTSGKGGNYTLPVSDNWSGVVTPSKPGYTFSPVSRSYSNVTTDQAAQNYNVITSINLQSTAAQDGWVLESKESSKAGGSLNATAPTLRLGDDKLKKQYLGILSFKTSGLPDNAVITSVMLKVRKNSITGGGDPLITLQGFMVDIKKGPFGTTALQTADFQTPANKSFGPFKPALASGWYSINLTTGKAYINKLATNSGLTQFRLRFKQDDNNNSIANYLSLYSGNAPAAARPQLVIHYYVP
jgi:hypothetical protein